MDESSATTTAEPSSPPLPPPGRPVSLKPAAIVLGLAVLVLLLFAGGAALFRSTPPRAPSKSSTAVAGTTLRAVGGLGALRPIVSAGQPPSNVLNAVVVPVGLRRLSHINYGGQANQYDQQVTFSVSGTQAAVIDFFKVAMKQQGWQIESSGPADRQPGIEVLGQIAGDDGWFWEMGAVVEPSTFGASGTGHASTEFSLRLIQEPDAD
jgi:hypothetical protein